MPLHWTTLQKAEVFTEGKKVDALLLNEKLELVQDATLKKRAYTLPTQSFWWRSLGRELWMQFRTLFGTLRSTPIHREKLARRHFKDFFFHTRGVTFYRTKPFPKAPEKPMLILTTRHHPYSSLFAYQLFDFPVLTPVDPIIAAQHVLPDNPWPNIGKNLKHVTYRDVSLNTAWPEIRTLLEKGYSVIAHINAGLQDPTLKERRPLYSAVRTILADSHLPADLYFLYLDGFERFPHASALSPIQVRCDLRAATEVYPPGTLSVDEKVEALTRFLSIWDYLWVEK
jgi:hypothetical protein